MCNFVEPALFKIITDFTSVDSIFRRVDSEDFTKKFECSFSVAFEIGEDLTHIEVPLRAEPACVEQEVARNRNAHDGAANINVWKVERLPIECDETLRADLADVGPKVRQQLTLIRLAISAGPIQFEPVNADANDSTCTWIETEAVQDFLTVVVRIDVEENFASTGGNHLGLLPNGFDVNHKRCWLPHESKDTHVQDRSGAASPKDVIGNVVVIKL
jgi:hypothetical protein